MTWDSFIDQVKQANDLVRIITENGITLKKSGKVLKALCPFHPDKKTPSFTVYPETQTWYCFGCNRKGDVYSFLQQIKNYSFKEALQELSSLANITFPNLSSKQEPEFKKKTTQRRDSYYHW